MLTVECILNLPFKKFGDSGLFSPVMQVLQAISRLKVCRIIPARLPVLEGQHAMK